MDYDRTLSGTLNAVVQEHLFPSPLPSFSLIRRCALNLETGNVDCGQMACFSISSPLMGLFFYYSSFAVFFATCFFFFFFFKVSLVF